MFEPGFWMDRKVFLTGHTGFKGSWLALLLDQLGAEVTGYALAPDTDPNLFEAARVADTLVNIQGDIRDRVAVQAALDGSGAEIVLHLAAQSLVGRSYQEPAETFATNIMGTVNILEAIRRSDGVQAAVIITSDKCYEAGDNRRPHIETDRLGGHDPYSASKAAAEIVVQSYRSSFPENDNTSRLATARAGNAFGGGDWAPHRLLPDLMRAYASNQSASLRNPNHLRPWQFVLDPLIGYLMLAERLLSKSGTQYADAWNFAPDAKMCIPVSYFADQAATYWGDGANWRADGITIGHENDALTLDNSKAQSLLGWRPRIGIDKAIKISVDWYKNFVSGGDAREITAMQINEYLQLEFDFPHSPLPISGADLKS